MSNTSWSGSGIGFVGLLAIVFITLKLTHVIDWSWWWVLVLLWGSVVLWVLIVLVVILGATIIGSLRVLRDFFTKP